jgi:2,3-dihydroxyphenylpropionate 1,2-dioxygenase
MSFMTACLSHAPLAFRESDENCSAPEFFSAAKRVRQQIEKFAPELIIEFAPDHYNGFFYDAMPNFCVGLNARSVGDWNTFAGDLNVPFSVALELVKAIRASNIDIDLSYRMKVDHGTVQPLELLMADVGSCPIVPIMVNCAAPPMPAFLRVRLLGEAVGRFTLATGKRVLFLGSGGLSHDPPIPQIQNSEGSIRDFLIEGRNPSAEARTARERRIVDAAEQFMRGSSRCREPNAAWDASILDALTNGRLNLADGWAEDQVTEQGGCGAHELRTWIAAFAALSVAGAYDAEVTYYQVVREWLTGMGIMTAMPRRIS